MKNIREFSKSYYEGKRIVVTGAFGYIGSAIVNILSDISCNLVLLTREKKKKVFKQASRALTQIIQFDIAKENNWDEILKNTDIIFHLAAQTSSRLADQDPVLDLKTNVLPVAAIIESAKKQKKPPQIVYSATVTQAGLTPKLPVTEDFKDAPITIYDINKLTAEKYLQFYAQRLGGKAVSLRLSNIYGPSFTNLGGDRNIVNNMIIKALSGENLPVYGKGDFIRDYVYISDVASAFLLAGINMEKISGNYYIISSGKGSTFLDVMNLIVKQVGIINRKRVRIDHIEAPIGLSPIEFRNFIGDSMRFKKSTNWQIEVKLEEGVKKTIEYFNKK